MEKFKEKKFIEISDIIGMLAFILMLVGLLLCLVSHYFIYLVVLMFLIGFICAVIIGSFSDKQKYTDQFIKYIEDKLSKANSLEDLLKVEKEFIDLSIEGRVYNLKNPEKLKTIHRKINAQIEILNKITQ